MTRYSRRQLVLAKCAVVGLIALVAGPFLADRPQGLAASILGVVIAAGIFVAAYEALSHTLAAVMGRFWRDSAPTELGEESAVQPSGESTSSGRPRPRDVLKAMLAYLAAQGLVWFVVGLVAVKRAGADLDHAAFIRALVPMVPVALPASLLAGGIALLLVLRSWQRRFGTTALTRILGLSWGTARQITAGAWGGAILVALILPMAAMEPAGPVQPDIMTQLAASSGSALRAWVISAVVLAPPIEELMFRGVLLGGLAAGWNLRVATLISGLTFWLMHAPEFGHWPAAVSIGLLTLLATWLRLRTRALGPSIAAHFVYNLVLAGLLSLAMTYKGQEQRWAQLEPVQRTAEATRN